MKYFPLVLIAEDIPLNMMLIASMVRKIAPEAEVIEVSNGRKAVEVVERIKIDLIFMDIQMPEMDGFEATERIRQLEAINGVKHPVPIVAVTAFTFDHKKHKCLQVGMNDFLSKPINKESITQVLKKYLKTGASKINGYVQVVPSNSRNNHFDIKALAERTEIEETALIDLAKKAAMSLSSHMEALSLAIANDNRPAIKYEAHTIKGIGLNISFTNLAVMAKRLEFAAQEDAAEINSVFASIQKEVSTIQGMLC